MRALICTQACGLHDVFVADLPVPTLGPQDVLIRVEAAGVNYYDTLIVQGRYQIKPARPFVPGGECAGVVEAIGAAVTQVHIGQRVAAFTHIGAFAQFCKAPEQQTFLLPDAVTFEQAAAALVAYGTAWFALHDRGRLHANERVLVLGAAGGVGLAAVDIARRCGAQVTAAASSDERLALCQALGAQTLINYATSTARDQLKTAAGERGFDVVIDVVGGLLTESAVRVLAWRGRLLVIGFAAGEIPRVATNLILLKGCEVSGVLWDGLLARESQVAQAQVSALMQAIASGELHPQITLRLPLQQADQGLALLAQRLTPGKIILLPQMSSPRK